MEQRLTCLDLFCGAGGLSKGFLDAGYDVVLGVDWDDAELQTFQKNHGDAEAMKLDLYNHDKGHRGLPRLFRPGSTCRIWVLI